MAQFGERMSGFFSSGGGGGSTPITLPLAVSDGGTGVTTSSGANSVVLRDADGNISTNALFDGFSSVVASGTQIVLTSSSIPNYVIMGSGGQTIKLPDATTLPIGAIFTFNNNQSSGSILVNNNSNSLIATIPSGGYVSVVLLSKPFAAGNWDRHDQAPSNVTWSTNTFNVPASITGATWNGELIAINRGGTGSNTQNFVDLTTSQIVGGAKTFSTSPILSSLVVSQILALDGSGNIQSLDIATYPSLTQLSYVKGVTSAIQTQIDAKQSDSAWVDASSQSISGWSGTPTKLMQYKLLGSKTAIFQFEIIGTGSGTTATLTLPFTSSAWGNQYMTYSVQQAAYAIGVCSVAPSSTTLTFYPNATVGALFTNTQARNLKGQIIINLA